MESTDIPNNLPEDTEASAMESACTIPAEIKESNEENHREAICKRCGAIWHPKKSDTRRPTRCPYCLSRKTEWIDVHPELLELRDKRKHPDADEAEKWNARETAEDNTLESAALNEEDTLSDTEDREDDEIYSECELQQDDTNVSSRSLPASTAVSAEVSAGHSKQKGIPIAALYLILGVMLTYGLIRFWNCLRKPSQKKETNSRPAEASFTTENMTAPLITGTSHMGLVEMAMKQHHLL